MELNKYYTPEIEEFHVGFEYQIKDPEVRDWNKEFACKEDFLNRKISCNPGDYSKINFGWVDKIFQINDSISKDDINYILINNILEPKLTSFRVKYLDNEDIESLGFTQITDDCFNLPIKDYRGRLNEEVRILFRKSILIYLPMNYNDKDNIVLFSGIIKNKSELKKLMKQLNINDTFK